MTAAGTMSQTIDCTIELIQGLRMIYFIVLIFVKFLQYNDEVSKWAIIRIEMLADNGRGGGERK